MKKILISLFVIILLFGAIYITGMALPEKHSVTVTDTIQAPGNEVYKRVRNVSEYDLWRKNLREVKVFSPNDWFEVHADADTILYRMTILEEKKKLLTTIESDHLPFGGHWIFEFTTPDMESTILTITENGEVYNPIYRFVSRFITGYDASIKEYLISLKRSFGDVD
ncbi:MAG: polyketide cyclase [Bacteroidetes bacterium]|jgi:hypothetical protein|nr:polyketide cyclase [Bacteroidota bacterium]